MGAVPPRHLRLPAHRRQHDGDAAPPACADRRFLERARAGAAGAGGARRAAAQNVPRRDVAVRGHQRRAALPAAAGARRHDAEREEQQSLPLRTQRGRVQWRARPSVRA